MWEMIPKENKIAENSEEVKGNEKQQGGWWMENYDVQGKAGKKKSALLDRFLFREGEPGHSTEAAAYCALWHKNAQTGLGRALQEGDGWNEAGRRRRRKNYYSLGATQQKPTPCFPSKPKLQRTH